MKIVSLMIVFERQAIEEFGWCCLSMLLNFPESEVFDGEALVLGEISFLILLSLVYISDIFSRLTLKHLFLKRIPLKTNIPIWLTNY